jgi:hypothetical protein
VNADFANYKRRCANMLIKICDNFGARPSALVRPQGEPVIPFTDKFWTQYNRNPDNLITTQYERNDCYLSNSLPGNKQSGEGGSTGFRD